MAVFLFVAISFFGFNSFEIDVTTFIGEKEMAILEKVEIERGDIPNRVTVIEADNLTEFMNLSHAPFYIAGATINDVIYIQNRKYLLKRFLKTLKHEIFHVILHRLNLPYWLEEGLVCELTGEWKGKSRRIMLEVENINPWDLKNQRELENYSYSCWIKAKKIFGF